MVIQKISLVNINKNLEKYLIGVTTLIKENVTIQRIGSTSWNSHKNFIIQKMNIYAYYVLDLRSWIAYVFAETFFFAQFIGYNFVIITRRNFFPEIFNLKNYLTQILETLDIKRNSYLAAVLAVGDDYLSSKFGLKVIGLSNRLRSYYTVRFHFLKENFDISTRSRNYGIGRWHKCIDRPNLSTYFMLKKSYEMFKMLIILNQYYFLFIAFYNKFNVFRPLNLLYNMLDKKYLFYVYYLLMCLILTQIAEHKMQIATALRKGNIAQVLLLYNSLSELYLKDIIFRPDFYWINSFLRSNIFKKIKNIHYSIFFYKHYFNHLKNLKEIIQFKNQSLYIDVSYLILRTPRKLSIYFKKKSGATASHIRSESLKKVPGQSYRRRVMFWK